MQCLAKYTLRQDSQLSFQPHVVALHDQKFAMQITKEAILAALQTVEDPDFKKDLVTLKMVEDIKINGNQITFTVVLTTPACPMKAQIESDCVAAIHHMVTEDAKVSVHFTSRVTSMRADLNLLPGVKNIIAVASGKGGVGKSTVATNLALTLAKQNARVGIMDADIHGPSLPLMFGLKGARPEVVEKEGKHKIIPIERFGVKVLSIGFLVDEMQAIVWRGPMVSSALRQFVTDVEWGELDYLIIDLPPGTGDIHLTMVQTMPVTGAVIVTTPQEVAMADAKKGIAMFNMGQVKVPVLGVIENMAYFTPAELPDNKYYLFGKGGGQKLADAFELPLLGQIPIVQSIREGGDLGVPAAIGDEPIAYESFEQLAQQLAQQVSIRNANMAPTKPVEISV